MDESIVWYNDAMWPLRIETGQSENARLAKYVSQNLR